MEESKGKLTERWLYSREISGAVEREVQWLAIMKDWMRLVDMEICWYVCCCACLWQTARSADFNVECHLAEGSPSSSCVIPQGLCTDQHWCNHAACQPQYTADRRRVLRGRKTYQVNNMFVAFIYLFIITPYGSQILKTAYSPKQNSSKHKYLEFKNRSWRVIVYDVNIIDMWICSCGAVFKGIGSHPDGP